VKDAFARTVTVSGRNRRALWIAVLFLGPLLVWRWVGMPLMNAIVATDGRVESERLLLEHELALLRQSSSLEEAWEAAAQRLESHAVQLFGGRGTEAPASFASYLRETADKAGVELNQLTGPVHVSDSSGVLHMAVEGQATTDLEGALSFLGAMEAGPRLLLVRAIDLRISPDATVEPGGPAESLTLRFRAEGFTLATTVAAPEGQPIASEGGLP
jgi:hypothetical protein